MFNLSCAHFTESCIAFVNPALKSQPIKMGLWPLGECLSNINIELSQRQTAGPALAQDGQGDRPGPTDPEGPKKSV